MGMPLLVINMGGEMIYILEQRLRAQSIPAEKSEKVLVDVVRTMYSKNFISELFNPKVRRMMHAPKAEDMWCTLYNALFSSTVLRPHSVPIRPHHNTAIPTPFQSSARILPPALMPSNSPHTTTHLPSPLPPILPAPSHLLLRPTLVPPTLPLPC